VWILQAFFKRHYKFILVGIWLGIAVSFVSILFIKYQPKSSERITIGLVGQPTIDNLPFEILQKLSLGLTTVSPDGQPLPGLASSWTVSSDLLTYTFYLVPGVKWIDKKPVKGQDLNYNFKDAAMSALTDSSVEIKLREPYTPLPVIVSRTLFKHDFIGVGPYKIASTKKAGDKVIEVDLSALEGTGKKDISYHIYPTEEASLTAWRLGEVKTVKEITQLPPPEWKADISMEVKTDRYVGLFFNLQDSVVGEKTLRQAFAYGIKNKSPEGTLRAVGPISPFSWAANPNIKKYDYDKTRAKQLLSKAATSSASLHLTISTFPSLLPFAEGIKNDLKDLGLSVDIQAVSTVPESFQMLLVTQMVPPDPDQYNLWHSTQVSNLTAIKNPKIDKLLEDGRRTEGMSARKEIYWDFQKYLVEEVPVIFLYHPVVYTITRP
jgi:peptide/nickel transport system substrate-binding protein